MGDLGILIWIAIGVVALALVPVLTGMLLPRRVTGMALLLKQLKALEIDPAEIGRPALEELVRSCENIARAYVITDKKPYITCFAEAIERAAFETANLIKRRRAPMPNQFPDSVLVKHQVLAG